MTINEMKQALEQMILEGYGDYKVNPSVSDHYGTIIPNSILPKFVVNDIIHDNMKFNPDTKQAFMTVYLGEDFEGKSPKVTYR